MTDLRTFRYRPKPVTLTAIQTLVVQLVCCGLADKEIAHFLGMSSSTVKSHVSRAIRDMGLFRRHQIVRYIFENGLFDPESAEARITARQAARSRRKPAAAAIALAHVSP